YTPESWSVFEEAITTAETVLANEEATQEEVQSALKDLRLAEIALEKVEEPKEVDKRDLVKAVDSAKARVEEDYTPESWSVFEEAITTAETVLANEEATQEEVQSALKDLRLAEIALEKVEEPKEVDKSELVKAVDSAKARVEEDYTPESWSVFEEAITTAEIVLANEEATQEEVQSALKDLRLAEIALEKVEEPKEVDKSELVKAVDSAKARVEEDYTPESWSVFEEAITTAEIVLANEEATQEEVQSALKDLRLAEIALEKVEEQEAVDKSELAKAVA